MKPKAKSGDATYMPARRVRVKEAVGILKGLHEMTAAKIIPKSWADRLTVNLKGGVWVGLFTFTMIAGCINALFLEGKDIPEGVRWIYGIVIGTFGATKGVGKLVNGKNGQPVEED